MWTHVAPSGSRFGNWTVGEMVQPCGPMWGTLSRLDWLIFMDPCESIGVEFGGHTEGHMVQPCGPMWVIFRQLYRLP